MARIENVEENHLMALLLKSARENNGRIEVAGGIEGETSHTLQ